MAAVRPAATPGWVVDRQFFWLVSALFIAGYALPSLPSGLIFPSVQRLQLDDDPTVGGGVSFFQMWMPLISLSTWVLLQRYRLVVAMFPDLNRMLLVLLSWQMLSALWAPDFFSTVKQVVSIIGVTILALAATLASWNQQRFVRLLRGATTLMLVASLVMGIVAPDIGIQHEDAFELAGSWRGISYQKNGLGQLGAMGAILWAHAWLAQSTSVRVAWSGMGLSLLLIVLSRSSTSLSLSILSIGAMLLVMRPPVKSASTLRKFWLAIWLGIVAPFSIYLMFVGSFDYDAIATPIASVFGKDATFSGRTLIWNELFIEIGKHPWMGIGFNSFWAAAENGPAAEAIRHLQWRAPSGHNGYLDMINEIGLIGFFLFVAFLVSHFRAIARLRRFDPASSALHLTLIVYVMLANLTETGWFHPILLTHVVAMYSSAEVSRQLFEHRLQANRALKESIA